LVYIVYNIVQNHQIKGYQTSCHCFCSYFYQFSKTVGSNSFFLPSRFTNGWKSIWLATWKQIIICLCSYKLSPRKHFIYKGYLLWVDFLPLAIRSILTVNNSSNWNKLNWRGKLKF